MLTSVIELASELEQWESQGVKHLSNGTKLVAHVPHVAPKAWFHKIYAPLNEDQVKELEEKTEQLFPIDFRNFLTQANGLNLFSDSLSIDGYRFSFARIGDAAIQPYHLVTGNRERPWKCPKDWLFFGGYSWDGSKLFFNVAEGIEQSKVYRCERDDTKVLNEWKSFWHFLTEEVHRLSALYNGKGEKIDPVTPTIPSS